MFRALIRALYGMGLLLLTTLQASAASSWLMSDETLGPIKIGMTVREVERATNQKLAPIDRRVFGDSCWVTHFTTSNDHAGSLFYFVFNHRHLMVIGVEYGNPIAKNLRTAEGIGFGSTLETIKATYGKRLKISSPPEFDGALLIELHNVNNSRAIVFSTTEGRLTGVRLGTLGYVRSMEDCL